MLFFAPNYDSVDLFSFQYWPDALPDTVTFCTKSVIRERSVSTITRTSRMTSSLKKSINRSSRSSSKIYDSNSLPKLLQHWSVSVKGILRTRFACFADVSSMSTTLCCQSGKHVSWISRSFMKWRFNSTNWSRHECQFSRWIDRVGVRDTSRNWYATWQEDRVPSWLLFFAAVPVYEQLRSYIYIYISKRNRFSLESKTLLILHATLFVMHSVDHVSSKEYYSTVVSDEARDTVIVDHRRIWIT